MTVVKISRPVKPPGPLVIADQDCRFVELTRDERILKDLGQDKSAYFEAERDMGAWKIGKRIEDQKW